MTRRRISAPDRVLLLLTGLVAAYQVAVGINGLGVLAILAYTVAFGVLLMAALLLIIFGFDILESPLVVIVAAIVPLSLSLGLVLEYIPAWGAAYLAFTILGLAGIATTRYAAAGRVATIVLALVHGIAGLLIFALPVVWSLLGRAPLGFAVVGAGGALIGAAGLLLAFLKAGRPILPKDTIFAVLPGLLLLMTAAFVAGLAMG